MNAGQEDGSSERWQGQNIKALEKSETRMTASVLKQDLNTRKVQENTFY